MIPAPAQGAIAVASLSSHKINEPIRAILNHSISEITTTVERDFMNAVEAGCSFPLGAIAKVKGQTLHLEAVLNSPDGKLVEKLLKEVHLDHVTNFGKICGEAFANSHSGFIAHIKENL